MATKSVWRPTGMTQIHRFFTLSHTRPRMRSLKKPELIIAFFHCFFDTAYCLSWRKYVTLLIRVLRDSLKNCLLNLKSSGTDLISDGKFRSNVLSVKAWKDKHYEERLGTSIKRGMWTFIREVLRNAKFTPTICQAYGNSKEFQT